MIDRSDEEPAAAAIGFPLGIIIGGLLMLAGHAALGAPPPGTDPDSTRAAYFRSLMRPGMDGASCCDASDCRPVEWRIAGDHYQAFLTDKFPNAVNMESRWIDIPPDKVLKGAPGDPEGEATLCWTPGMGVLCFNPASGT